MRLGIRVRLTAAFAAAMLAILVVAGLFVYLRVRADLNETLDESLQSRADDVAALVAASDAGTPDLSSGRLVESEDSFAQVLDSNGAAIASTLPGAGPALTPEEAAEAAAGGAVAPAERPLDGVEGEARVTARAAGTRVVVVGAGTEDRSETLAGLTGAFAVGAPIAILLASGLGYLLAGRAMAPVEAMRRRAAEIGLERSGERLPLPASEDELRRLGRTLNEMLDRIEASLEREREFVADASHELRTPLANLRAELELALRRERSPQELRAALASASEEVERLSRLAEDLLVIARSDRGRLSVKRESTELGPLLDRVRGRFGARAADAGRVLAVEVEAGLSAELDPLRIEQALGNLVDNALRHGAGPIRLGADRNGDRVRLEVSDEGAGFGSEFAPRAFERFTRAEAGRTGGGAGLGLAIVRAIAAAHGGEAELAGDGDPRTTVRVTVPTAG